ncbi:Scr1 family TA system antitoxin-like transcriptional regulator [Streptomonospora arabica]|uniref:Scr1 family TA system antitoxin-like transcriptional regulator n=1 Tax=Streptomonospora arabica TaxID=412417 RepID=A0ABV9ST26_9ACTN
MGSHAGLASRLGSWTFPGPLDSPIAWIGTSACSVFLDQHGETERYSVTFGDLQGFALSTKRTAEFIADVAASPGE